MFVVNVHSVSVQNMNCKVISWYTRITNNIVVVYAVNILKDCIQLYVISKDVVINFDLLVSTGRQIMKYVDSICSSITG